MGSSAKLNGTAGVGAGAGWRPSGPGEKCNSTAPSAGKRGSGKKKIIKYNPLDAEERYRFGTLHG